MFWKDKNKLKEDEVFVVRFLIIKDNIITVDSVLYKSKDFQECIFFFKEAIKEKHLEEYWKDKKIAYVLVKDKEEPSLKWELTVEKMKINGIDVLEDDEN